MYSPEWAVVPEIDAPSAAAAADDEFVSPHEVSDRITELRRQMMEAAEKLEYERAGELRDRIKRLERHVFGLDRPPAPAALPPGSAHSRPSRGRGGAKSQPPRSPDAGDASAAAGHAVGAPKPQPSISRADKKPAANRGRRGTAASAPTQGRLKIVPDRPE